MDGIGYGIAEMRSLFGIDNKKGGTEVPPF